MTATRASSPVASSSDPLKQWEEDLHNPMQAQRETLREILHRFQSIPMLQKHGINPDCSLEEYVKMHPVTTYEEDYEETILAVAAGKMEPSALVGTHGDELLGFGSTSGTSSGRGKLIPRTAVDVERRKAMFGLLSAKLQTKGLSSKKRMTAARKGKITTHPSGLTSGGVSTLALVDPRFESMMRSTMVSPLEICRLDSPLAVVTYAHILSSLLHREQVGSISANFANQIVAMFVLLQQHWQTLVKHLQHGVTLTPGLVDQDSLAILQPMLPDGNQTLAQTVSQQCQAGFQGIIPRLFPNCTHVAGITTGTMAPYAKKLAFFSGNIPIISHAYGSSEGMLAMNTDPLGEHKDSPNQPARYTLHPRGVFFEFLPVHEEHNPTSTTHKQNGSKSTQEQQKETSLSPSQLSPLTLDQLELHQPYEIIVTSGCGLFRYRLGDVVRAVDYEHATPVIEFLYRSGTVLSLLRERMTEKQLMDAVASAQHEVFARSSSSSKEEKDDGGTHFTDWIVDADRERMPPRYVLFCEDPLMNERTAGVEGDARLEPFVKALDEALCKESHHYQVMRSQEEVGAIAVVPVRLGCFARLAAKTLDRGTDPSQYKVPRCVKSEAVREHFQQEAFCEYTGETS